MSAKDDYNLFIFGAGASYGSDDNKDLVPPLACNLYEGLQKYDDIKNNQNVQFLKKNFEEDFEKGFLELCKRDPKFISVFQRHMADFFFQYGASIPISQSNLYYKLAQLVKASGSKIVLASLNYERILELSFRCAGISLGINDRKGDMIELCLPHGYCNIFSSIKATDNSLIFSGEGASLHIHGPGDIISFSNGNIPQIPGMNVSTSGGDIYTLEEPSEFKKAISINAFPPVMSYFESSKFTTSGADFIQTQRDRFAMHILNAKKIAIIGVKVREHDAHIWDPLVNTAAKILYCAGEAAAKEYSQWCNAKNRVNDIVLDGYFKDNLDEIVKFMLEADNA